MPSQRAAASGEPPLLLSASMRALSWLLLCSFRGTSALQPSRPGVSRRPLLQHALALGVLAPGAAAAAAEKKPSLKEVVAQLDAGTPKEERNEKRAGAQFAAGVGGSLRSGPERTWS